MMRFTLDELAYRVLPQVAPGRAFADSEWRTLRAAAELLLDDRPFDLSATRVADNVERFLCDGRSKRAWRCRVLLTLLELMPLTVYGKCFSALTVLERRELFDAHVVGGRGLWAICAKVRYLVLMGAYGDESVPGKLGVWIPGSERPTRAQRNKRSRSLPLVGPAYAHARTELAPDSPV